MENLIKEVIELDKLARKQVELLETEKSKINEYILEQKKILEKKYKDEISVQIKNAKKQMITDLENRKKEARTGFAEKAGQLEEDFQKNKQKWIDSIYEYCIQE